MMCIMMLMMMMILGLSSSINASVLVADNTMSRMVELNADAPFCSLYTDRGVIQRMILSTDPKKVRQMSANLVADLEETCKELNKGKNQTPGGGLIYPGTKWCGPGTTAQSYDDLGPEHRNEDYCCREHDHCQNVINPDQCIHGICNNSPFTRSHCDCDAKFRRCLQNLNTEVANTLGALFFNVIQVICFKERRPCSQWQNESLEWQTNPRYHSTVYTHDWTLSKFIRRIFNMILKLIRGTVQLLREKFNNSLFRSCINLFFFFNCLLELTRSSWWWSYYCMN